jgi:pyrimidine-nucleoside phosphorylase
MNFPSLIEFKRDGQPLTDQQIREFVAGLVAREIPDYQVAAFLMAVFFRGMTPSETRALTLAMRDSGEVLQFPDDPRPLVDKHSTGGVGDKVSLVLAPLLACLGFRVPMISGRGLGITGGTLDKLESLPGFRTTLSSEEIVQIVQNVGCVICGQTDRMVPADKALYSLRDVTGTVPSIPLITASILSKKLAEGIAALLLDVKFGAAAFMPTQEKALELAHSMVALGQECGVNTRALLTNMDAPLGRAAGNWLEVKEVVECLEGRGPKDLEQLVIECAAHLLEQTGKAKNLDDGRAHATRCLTSGQPREKWSEMLRAQGADLKQFNAKLDLDHTAPVVVECRTSEKGFVASCNARIVGEVVRDLGGGRLARESAINSDVGVDELAKPGEVVGIDSLLARVHAATDEQAARACERLKAAFEFTGRSVEVPPLVQQVIDRAF